MPPSTDGACIAAGASALRVIGAAFGPAVAPLTGARDDAARAIYRKRYAQGIPAHDVAAQEKDARALYAVLRDVGGETLVGPSKDLRPGTFWRGGGG